MALVFHPDPLELLLLIVKYNKICRVLCVLLSMPQSSTVYHFRACLLLILIFPCTTVCGRTENNLDQLHLFSLFIYLSSRQIILRFYDIQSANVTAVSTEAG